MPLRQLGIRGFRCFAEAELDLTDRVLIHGNNASGKTSLLEAVFYLAHGRSFRTQQSRSLSRDGEEGFRITGRIQQGERAIPVGIERSPAGQSVRIGGVPAKSWAQMAEALPVQLIDSEVHKLLDEGPRYRRRFIDWGTFHVEQGFLSAWRRYQRTLRQRNRLLKERASLRELAGWDRELAGSGEALNVCRERYLFRLQGVVATLARTALELESVRLEFRRGWQEEESLADALGRYRDRDRQMGITQRGPHRAELRVLVNEIPAQERVSRGQHKLLAVVLMLAQGRLLNQVVERTPILLLDDIAAELDSEHLARFEALLRDQPGQILFTAISPAGLPDSFRAGARAFHVEHGRLTRE